MVVVGRGGAGGGDTPQDDVGGEPLRSGNFLEDDCLGSGSVVVLE